MILSLLLSLCCSCSKTEQLTATERGNQQTACSDRASPRIESSKEGVLLFNPTGAPNTFDTQDLQTDIGRYWKEQEVLVFSIPFRDATKLLKTSPDNLVSLALNDMEDTRTVTAEWMPFDQTEISTANGCMSYFNLDESILESFGEAIFELKIAPKDQVIDAYIGRSAKGSTALYFMLGAAELHVVDLDDGSRGFSAACGAKLPPN